MKQTADKEIGEIIEYLFNDLTEEKTEEIEEKIFSDENFVEKVKAVKSKIIDAYILGQLEDSLKQEFEEKFLSTPDGKREVEETMILREELHKLKTADGIAVESVKTGAGWFGLGKSAAFVYGFAALLILLVTGAVLFFYLPKQDQIVEIVNSNTVTPIQIPSETQTINISNDNTNQNKPVTPTRTPENNSTPNTAPSIRPKETFKPYFATLYQVGKGNDENKVHYVPKGVKVKLTLVVDDSVRMDTQLVITVEGKKLPKIFKPEKVGNIRIVKVEIDESFLRVGDNNIQIQPIEEDISLGDFPFRRR